MKKLTLPLLLITILSSSSLFAQSGKEIVLKTNFFTGMKFYQNDSKIAPKTVLEIMKSNSEAYDLMKKSTSQASGATIVSMIGGGLVGWPIGTALGGGDPNWALAGAGLGVITLSAIIYSSAQKKATQAVSLYNEGLGSTASRTTNLNVRLFAKPAEFGISISF